MKIMSTWAGIAAAAITTSAIAWNADETGPAIVIYSAGIDMLKESPKDRPLHDALVLMEETGLSLPPNVSRKDARSINLVMEVLMSRMSFEMKLDDQAITQGRWDQAVQLQMAVYGNDGVAAGAIDSKIRQVMHDEAMDPGIKVPGSPNIIQLSAPIPVYYGVEEIDKSKAVVFSLNAKPDTNGVDLSQWDLPDNAKINFAGTVDFNRMNTLFNSAFSMAGMVGPPGSQEAMGIDFMHGMMTKLGIMGPDALRLDWACGSSDGLGHMDLRCTNYGKHFEFFLGKGGVTRDHLKMVPQDAGNMSISKVRLGNIFEMFPSAKKNPEGQPVQPSPVDMMLGMAHGMLGINLQTEFLDYLGDTVIAYRSNTTGGNGMMSSVMLISLDNEEGMQQSLKTIRASLNRMAETETMGYVRLMNWTNGSCGDITTLTFPGIPIPLELSVGVCNGYMIMGLSPQAVTAAAGQGQAGTSIIDNPRFREMGGMKGIGSLSVQFFDVPEVLADGYALTGAIMAAISNYTRPRMEPSKGINMVMPTYNELAEGARANVYICTLDESGTLVVKGVGDESVTVQLTAALSDPLSLLLPMAMSMGNAMDNRNW